MSTSSQPPPNFAAAELMAQREYWLRQYIDNLGKPDYFDRQDDMYYSPCFWHQKYEEGNDAKMLALERKEDPGTSGGISMLEWSRIGAQMSDASKKAVKLAVRPKCIQLMDVDFEENSWVDGRRELQSPETRDLVANAVDPVAYPIDPWTRLVEAPKTIFYPVQHPSNVNADEMTSASHDEITTRFFDLPFEIRAMILRHLFEPDSSRRRLATSIEEHDLSKLRDLLKISGEWCIEHETEAYKESLPLREYAKNVVGVSPGEVEQWETFTLAIDSSPLHVEVPERLLRFMSPGDNLDSLYGYGNVKADSGSPSQKTTSSHTEREPIPYGEEGDDPIATLLTHPILQCNRQLRIEALPIAISTNVFDIISIRAFARFMNLLGPKLWPYIRHLDITDPFFLLDEDERNTLPEDQPHTTSTEIIEIISALPGLRTLHVDSGTTQNLDGYAARYEPLKRLRGLREFVHIVSLDYHYFWDAERGAPNATAERLIGSVRRVLDIDKEVEGLYRQPCAMELVPGEEWEGGGEVEVMEVD